MIFRRASFEDTTYTKIPNALLRGGGSVYERADGLKPDSLGVLCYLLSHAAEWTVSNRQLAKVFGISTGKVTNITNQLSAAGYIERVNGRDAEGKTTWDWLVYDTLDRKNQDRKNQDLTNQDLENQDHKNCDQRTTIAKKNNSKEKLNWKEQLSGSLPSGVPKQSWLSWWEHKQKNNRAPSQVAITRQTKDFEIMVKAGFDIGELVSYAIARGTWQRIGDPDWGAIQQFKNKKRNDDILGAIK
jgi:hypothetical protein|tara:strand:+ start:71 stop:799 length:729 start_codon:yes stop_codon:yes gene_type:complete